MILLYALSALAVPVEGVVREKGTGDVVPGAVVVVDGANHGTDMDGRFTLDLPEGTAQLRVLSDAHQPLDLVVTVPVGHPVRAFLVPLASGGEIVVESFRPTPHISRHVADGELALKTPGTLEDAIRLVQSMPGVTVQRDLSPTGGDLSVRGSRPGDNRYYLDGIELPYLYHFNQYASVFPATDIDTLELFPSTYGSAFGDATGAIVEATSKSHRPKSVHGGGLVNFVMAGADVRAPLGDDTWVSASGRRSYQDIAGEQTSQYVVWPVFWDYSAQVSKGSDPDNSGTLFAYGAGDSYTRAVGELDLLDPVETQDAPLFEYQRAFHAVGGRIKWRKPNTNGRLVNALVLDDLQGRLAGDLGQQDLRSGTWTTRTDMGFFPTENISVYTGAELRAEWTSMRVVDPGAYGLLVVEEAPALVRGIDVDGALFRFRSGVYAEVHAVFGPVRVMPGLRLASDSLGPWLLPEPRLAVRWQLAPQSQLKAAFGRYNQAPDSQLLIPGTGTEDLPTTGSWQAGLGWEQTIAGRLEITLDTYGKLQNDVIFQPVQGQPEVLERGRSYGVELVVRYRLRETIALWAWAALARAELWRNDAWMSDDADQPYAIGLVGSWDFAPGWNAGLRYRLGAGLPYTQVEQGLYDATTDQWLPDPGAENAGRLPLYQKLDLHLEYTHRFPTWSLTVYTELWMVPESSARLYPAWSYDFSEEGWVTGPTVLPLAGLRARF